MHMFDHGSFGVYTRVLVFPCYEAQVLQLQIFMLPFNRLPRFNVATLCLIISMPPFRASLSWLDVSRFTPGAKSNAPRFGFGRYFGAWRTEVNRDPRPSPFFGDAEHQTVCSSNRGRSTHILL